MNRADFDKLPPAMQLRVLARVVFEREALADIDVGRKPLPPKYDARINRAGSAYQWASETSLEGLTWWRDKYRTSAAAGGEWADKEEKRALALDRWIAWRSWFPGDRWQGERNDHVVTGAAPADKPQVYQYEERTNGSGRQGGSSRQQQNNPPPPEDDADDIGFA